LKITAIRTVFLALDLGSISAAGARLGVPPSTISRRIKEVESDLGRRLIIRGGRGVSAADEAIDVLLKLRDVLQTVDDCYTAASAQTKLRVTAPLEMTISLLPGLIPAFQNEFPNVFIELIGNNQIVGLVETDFDLAIRTGPLSDTSLIAKKLPKGGFKLVAAPSMVEKIEDVNDLASTLFLQIVGPPLGLSGQWKGEPFNITPPLLAKLNTFTAALPSLLAGLAYAQMPQHLVKEHLETEALVEFSQVRLNAIPVHALYPKRHRGKDAIAAFIKLVDTALR